jgi:hypothetical protein
MRKTASSLETLDSSKISSTEKVTLQAFQRFDALRWDNVLLDFFRWFFSARSKNDWKSWRSLVVTFPAVVGVFLVVPQEGRESAAASRQQTTQGRETLYWHTEKLGQPR